MKIVIIPPEIEQQEEYKLESVVNSVNPDKVYSCVPYPQATKCPDMINLLTMIRETVPKDADVYYVVGNTPSSINLRLQSICKLAAKPLFLHKKKEPTTKKKSLTSGTEPSKPSYKSTKKSSKTSATKSTTSPQLEILSTDKLKD